METQTESSWALKTMIARLPLEAESLAQVVDAIKKPISVYAEQNRL